MDLIETHDQALREFEAMLHGRDITKTKKTHGRASSGSTTVGLLAFRYSPEYQAFMGES